MMEDVVTCYMALELTEQELKDLGFTIDEKIPTYYRTLRATKSVGGNDAFFYMKKWLIRGKAG
jgi:hypothetical protein